MVSVILPWDFPGGPQMVKNLPAVWETRVQSLGQENPLEKEWLPIPVFWPGEFHGLYTDGGHKESDTTEQFSQPE